MYGSNWIESTTIFFLFHKTTQNGRTTGPPCALYLDMLKKKCKSTKNGKTAAAPWVSLPRCAKQTIKLTKIYLKFSVHYKTVIEYPLT